MSVVGAGTAGLICARRLGMHGLETEVYDQKEALGVPVRASGIVSISGLEGLGIGYSGCVTNTLYGANIHAAGKTMRIMSSKAMAKVLDRRLLNEVVRDEAEAAGARVATGRRMSGRDLDVLAKDGVVVGADGAVSSVARHFGLGEIGSVVLTYKAEYDVRAQDSRVVDLFFDRHEYPGLFAWLCPNAADVVEVGVGVRSGSGNAKRAFDRFLREAEVRDIVGGRRPRSEGASIIPMRLRKRIVDERRRVLLVGDAAGQVKPTTGGGIVFGGNGAFMAADAVSGYVRGSSRLSKYESDFRNRYGADLALHSAINRLYCSAGPAALGMIISAMNALRMDRFLGRYGDMDRPSLIIKRFFLRGLAR